MRRVALVALPSILCGLIAATMVVHELPYFIGAVGWIVAAVGWLIAASAIDDRVSK